MNIYQEDYCLNSDIENIDIEHCEEMLCTMIKAFYYTGNVEEFESGFEEIANQFGINIPSSKPALGNNEFKIKLHDKENHNEQ